MLNFPDTVALSALGSLRVTTTIELAWKPNDKPTTTDLWSIVRLNYFHVSIIIFLTYYLAIGLEGIASDALVTRGN